MKNSSGRSAWYTFAYTSGVSLSDCRSRNESRYVTPAAHTSGEASGNARLGPVLPFWLHSTTSSSEYVTAAPRSTRSSAITSTAVPDNDAACSRSNTVRTRLLIAVRSARTSAAVSTARRSSSPTAIW